MGGLAVLAALILGLVFLLRRRNRRDSSPETHGQVEVQQGGMPPMTEFEETKHRKSNTPTQKPVNTDPSFLPASPTTHSYPGSPQPPYSPGPPSYTTETHRNAHMSYELPGTQQFEMDSGQMYHPYRGEQHSPTA